MAEARDDLETLHPAAGDRLNCLWSAVGCWISAGLFLTAWWRPERLDDGRWVKYGVGVLLLEFILMHSGAFLNDLMTRRAGWDRTRALLGLTALYTVFGVGIALAFRSWWIFGTFALVTSGRIWAVIAGMRPLDRAISQRRVAASAMLFLGLMFATLFVPVPRGGLSPALLDRVWPDRRSGAWERQPQKALAMGAAYFLALGFVELRPPRKWKPPAAHPARSPGA